MPIGPVFGDLDDLFRALVRDKKKCVTLVAGRGRKVLPRRQRACSSPTDFKLSSSSRPPTPTKGLPLRASSAPGASR